jgi:hypothetical protein
MYFNKKNVLTKQRVCKYVGVPYPTLCGWYKSDNPPPDCKENLVAFIAWLHDSKKKVYDENKDGIRDLLAIYGDNTQSVGQIVTNHKLESGEVDDRSIDDYFEELKNRIKACVDIDEAKFLKMKVDALNSARKYEVELGLYTSNELVREFGMKLGSLIKSMLNRYENDLPVALEGLSSSEIQVQVRDYNKSILDEYTQRIGGLLK